MQTRRQNVTQALVPLAYNVSGNFSVTARSLIKFLNKTRPSTVLCGTRHPDETTPGDDDYNLKCRMSQK